jgi:hypothetical protein
MGGTVAGFPLNSVMGVRVECFEATIVFLLRVFKMGGPRKNGLYKYMVPLHLYV